VQEQHVYINALDIQDNYNFLKSVILGIDIMIIILPLTLLSYIFKSVK